jgi:alkylation response protein AidB-like acyl-CoA dehydrogenase
VDIELTGDQAAFAETTQRFLAAECPIGTVRALEADPAGFDRGWWQRGAALGWTSMLVAERDGGGCLSDHGLLDLVLVAESMGRFVAPGPLVPVSVVAAAVSRLGGDELRATVLPGLLDGSAVAAWCGPAPVQAERTDGDAVVLTGLVAPVEAAAQADHLLVTATIEDGTLVQAVVPADAAGVTVTPMGGLDLVRRFAQVAFDAVAVPASAMLDGADVAAEVERNLQIAVALQCAETVGAIDEIFGRTVDYLGDRWSFGRPLSSYQALKHRVADLKVLIEACAATATAAAEAVAADGPDAAEVVSAAKATIGAAGPEVLQDCVQLHGGIGVTWEHDLHLYLRRATVNRAMYGTPEEHRERVATRLLGAAS